MNELGQVSSYVFLSLYCEFQCFNGRTFAIPLNINNIKAYF